MNGLIYTKRKEEKMNLKKNPELIPLIEWWEKDGKSTVIWLLVAALAIGGWYGWKAHKAAVKAAAADSLVSAYTTEEIEDAATKFKGNPVEGSLKLRLAKSYFDAERFEEAKAVYEELEGKIDPAFADIVTVGKAQCLEALKQYKEAAAAFDAFAEANEKSCLALTAKLGAARSYAQAGDKAKALSRIDGLKKAFQDDELATARVEATESAIKRLK